MVDATALAEPLAIHRRLARLGNTPETGLRAEVADDFGRAVRTPPSRAPSLAKQREVGVVRERLGHANIAHTMQTYQHLLPGMQADAARVTEQLTRPVPPAETNTVERRRNTRRKSA